MSKKVLVTGSGGFIGKNLCQGLNENQFDLTEIKSSKDLDLCDNSQVESLPQVDVIVHLAASSYIPDSFKDPGFFYQNNVISTLNLLEKSRRDKAKFIFLSTYVYGAPQYLPIDETHQRNPLNPYTQSKVIGEDLCQAYTRDFGLDTMIFRPFNVYGPSQLNSFLIPSIINQLGNSEINLQDSRPKRDYIYIEDLVEAIKMAISAEKTGTNVYNIGSGISYSVQEVVDILIRISKSNALVKYANVERQGEVLNTVANIKKISTELGWKVMVDLQEGLMKTYHSYKKN
jgi:nucleoside-diphosphate-sugar epimerase